MVLSVSLKKTNSRGNRTVLATPRDKRLKVYKWTGEGYTPREIVNMLNRGENENGEARKGASRIGLNTIMNILSLPEAPAFITKFRTEFLKTLKDIPISEKKFRLYDMEKLRTKVMFMVGELNPMTKNDFPKFLQCTSKMIQILDLARNEMEYKPNLAIGIGFNNNGELNDLTDEQLRAQRDELIRKAANSIQPRSQALDDDPEVDDAEATDRSVEVLLAASEELRRDGEQLQERDHPVHDVRREKADDPGLSAVRVPEFGSGDDGVLRSEPVGEVGSGGDQVDHPRDGSISGVVAKPAVRAPDGGSDIR